ncbi:cellulose synthase catalytic subunit [Pseudonocardia petroleophila]|uniref:Glycosyltransferase n=1 Tax=Pseudonocardia petroleophila TaxID=37331 RepID=A0A7G7MQH2_9PSEU|nr:cellulose synthase catalytic subunit [Pseudonocardia petroleophila]QNG55033.1 glycosyltransferase [Pseudonocardia petroleophila]
MTEIADAVGSRARDFSALTGPLTRLKPGHPYRVTYRSLDREAGLRRRSGTVLLGVLVVAFDMLFVAWLLTPAHFPWVADLETPSPVDVVLIASIAVVEVFRLLNLISLALASVIVRDPVPIEPAGDLRVAFLTTIVPGKEPVDMVRTTLEAALRIRYTGTLDVWLLDEGDDPFVAQMCREIGVRHFSRNGVAAYNTEAGEFRARTKHGNYNAWIDRHGHDYDVFLSVDPDHVPLPSYAERMLGYFRDPDVAFVAGPQAYANSESFIARSAESQQFPFHSLIQRAANTHRAAMLVGTNNAVRIDALRSIGGIQDSITEDMATGLALHARRNPATGRRWDSVYTPDVVALGEGPTSWGDYFGQQLRWSRGTLEIFGGVFWRRARRLPPRRGLHYLLLMTFYPSMALSWVLGSINAIMCLVVGATGLVVSPTIWLALYVDVLLAQLWIFVRNRRYNVSPVETEGSPGLVGIFMSLLSAPLFAASLVQTVLGRRTRFVVTPKGAAAGVDGLWTFRLHLCWAALMGGALCVAALRGSLRIEVLLWPMMVLLICLAPVVHWLGRRRIRPDLEEVVPVPIVVPAQTRRTVSEEAAS